MCSYMKCVLIQQLRYWWHNSQGVYILKSSELKYLRVSSKQIERTPWLFKFWGEGIPSIKFHQMSTSSIKVYQCMHSPFFYCVWMKSQGRKSKKLYFLSHQSKYCYIYYNFVHIYETLGISTSQPHHSRQLIVLAHSPRSILSIIFDSVTQKLHFKV